MNNYHPDLHPVKCEFIAQYVVIYIYAALILKRNSLQRHTRPG